MPPLLGAGGADRWGQGVGESDLCDGIGFVQGIDLIIYAICSMAILLGIASCGSRKVAKSGGWDGEPRCCSMRQSIGLNYGRTCRDICERPYGRILRPMTLR